MVLAPFLTKARSAESYIWTQEGDGPQWAILLIVDHLEGIQEAGMEITLTKVFVFYQFLMERHRCFDSFDDKFVQRPFHLSDAFLTGRRPADEFGDH